jgi:hypothetical protein
VPIWHRGHIVIGTYAHDFQQTRGHRATKGGLRVQVHDGSGYDCANGVEGNFGYDEFTCTRDTDFCPLPNNYLIMGNELNLPWAPCRRS